MKFDLEKTGLERVMQPWQAEAWRVLWEIGVPMTSGDMKQELDNREVSTSGRGTLKGRGGVSRASVIFFLNDMVDKGFLTYTEETGKGGYHRVYETEEASDEESFKLAVAQGILTALKLDWGVSLEEIL